MPIIASPAVAAPDNLCCGIPTTAIPSSPLPISCQGMSILSAPISKSRGRAILSKMRSVTIAGGQKATISWNLHDPAGIPVDVSSCLCLTSESSASLSVANCPYKIMLRIQEQIRQGSDCFAEVEGYTDFASAQEGIIYADIPASTFKSPGIYFAEFGLVGQTDEDDDSTSYVLFSNVFTLSVSRGEWALNGSSITGPPSIAEVRMQLRDSSGTENYLLDTVKFDDAEIAQATVWAVQYWNEIPPDVGRYTTATFPHRYHWLQAIAGKLFQIAAEQFRANNFEYSAGGIQVNDQSKEPNYERAADRYLQEWFTFVKRKKAEINLGMAYGDIGSSYGRGYGSGSRLTW